MTAAGKECKECYYLTRGKCYCINCSVCRKWIHKSCTVFSKKCTDCGRNTRSKSLGKRNKTERSRI